MAKFWALQVIMFRVTLDKVPTKYRDAVVKILQDMEMSELKEDEE